jgi:RecB family endonuclease NucS
VKETVVPDVKEATPPEAEAELEVEEEAALAVQKKAEASTPAFSLDAPGLRRLLTKQLDLLEPGLRLVADKKGNTIGAGLSTAVGEIDLLARDGSGGFVVVMIAQRGQQGEKLVAETLQRIGWVRKHLGKGKQRVRGIVLMEQVPEDLGYASAAVAETVIIKTYRVGLAIEDVEI